MTITMAMMRMITRMLVIDNWIMKVVKITKTCYA